MTTPLQAIFLGVTTALFAYLGVAGLRRWAERRQILDIPNERSSHSQPTPRGGGLVIVILSTAGLILAWLLNPAISPMALIAYFAGAWLIAGVSWLDDLRSLPNRVRFAVHSLGAILALLAFGYWRVVSIPLIGSLDLGWLGLLVTFVWIAGLTNAYNFMDGIDGIAGGQAVVAGLGWAALGWSDQQPLVAAVGLLLAAASLGFLGHNWPPARIFMGGMSAARSWDIPLRFCPSSRRSITLVWPWPACCSSGPLSSTPRSPFSAASATAKTSSPPTAPISTNDWLLPGTAIAWSRCCTSGWPPRVQPWPCSGRSRRRGAV